MTDAAPETECPPEIRLAMAAFPVRRSYAAWRVVWYRGDGSYVFIPNNSGLDYKLRRNAQKEADRCNLIRWRGDGHAVVKRIRVTEEECGEEEE